MHRLYATLALLLILSPSLHSQTPSESTNGGSAASSVSPNFHPKGDYVSVNGARLWYESEGTGPALVLISGGPGISHDYFHPYFSSLANSYRVVYFDALGRGKSDRANSPKQYTLSRDVDDLEGLRKALGLGRINLLGHSYGGVVAQAYALRFPAFLQRLILVDTFFSAEMWQANNDNSNRELQNQFPEIWEKIQDVRAQGYSSCSKESQAVSDAPPSFPLFYDASNFDKVIAGGGSINNDVYCAMTGEDGDFLIAGDLGNFDFRRDLKKISGPMLILAGRYDRIAFPRWTIQYKHYAPQAKFVMLEKSGHFPFVEQTDETLGLLRDFLQH
jgi:proline iminopeptidase